MPKPTLADAATAVSAGNCIDAIANRVCLHMPEQKRFGRFSVSHNNDGEYARLEITTNDDNCQKQVHTMDIHHNSLRPSHDFPFFHFNI